MTRRNEPAEVTPAQPPPRTWIYVVLILLMPCLVLWHRDNALYTPPYYADPWFYLGYFRNLVEFKRDLFYGFYYGSRLSWILPGFLMHSVLPPLVSNAILHLAVQSTAALSFFHILRITAGIRSAFLATLIFSVQPWVWVATGWDYPDGAGIAYCLLAMALFTQSAAHPAHKWSLAGAGAALAAMLYSHIFLGTFAPLLLLYYLALAWAWHRTSLSESIRSLFLWAGAGFASVTAAFCGINYFLDGRFWFYGPSVARAVSMAKDFQFTRAIWINHALVAWLWPGVAGCVTAIVLLLSYVRSTSRPRDLAGLLFSVQLVLAVAYMLYLQARGTTVLGHYPYASYLLPFVFLVMGSSFWIAAPAMSFRIYALICCVAAAIFAALWYNPRGPLLPANPAAQRFTIVASACVLAVAFLLRRRTAGTLLGIAGFAPFVAVALAQTVNMGGVDLHGNREQYKRVLAASDRIDSIRKHRTVLFWFDRSDPDFHEYSAINAIYLAEFSRLGANFPRGCDAPVDPGTLVIVLSAKQNAVDLARSALNDCWRPFGMRPVLEAVEPIKPSGHSYTMAMLAAEPDVSLSQQPGQLFETIPLDRIKLGDLKASLQRTDAGLLVTTLPDYGAFAGRTSLGLDQSLQGKLAVYVKARVLVGKVGFGILDPGGKGYLLERFLRPSSAFTEVILPLPSPPVAGDLIICNARDDTSKAVIEKIEIRRMP